MENDEIRCVLICLSEKYLEGDILIDALRAIEFSAEKSINPPVRGVVDLIYRNFPKKIKCLSEADRRIASDLMDQFG